MIKIVVWFFYVSVAMTFIFMSIDQFRFHSDLKKSFPRNTSLLKAKRAKVSELFTLYSSYSKEDLIKVEAELQGMKGDSTTFDKITDAAFKTIIGTSITFFAAMASTSTGIISLIKDNVSNEVLLNQIIKAIDLFSNLTDGYGTIFTMAVYIFCFTLIYYMAYGERQSSLRKHFLAIEAVNKIKNLN
ncbi:hypothetical protein C2I18_14305 [Paenibacillus sp. PK3_47]|uniref:hypothetical protein n=1 Tax=Paenibacillus sp. PK3_47 TaxID=2072642 RepID=UPI00201D8210|nr:hypothetical protein [Paenibacillus sp. PK3_47]UQZ34591.1 hypothetical protein C2I18_14305 [Paenibacillus sp. PK3_47]